MVIWNCPPVITSVRTTIQTSVILLVEIWMISKTQYVVLMMVNIIVVMQEMMDHQHQVVTVERSFPMGNAVQVTVASMNVVVVLNVNTHTANMVAVVSIILTVR